MAQIGISYATLDEFTTYQQSGPQTITTTSQGTVTIITGGSRTNWQLEVRENYEYYKSFLALMNGISFALGFLFALLAVLVFLHWPRWTYLIPVLLVPIAAGLITWYIWYSEAPNLLAWGTPYILSQASAHLAGGLIGIIMGRRLARLVVTLLLPPRLRPALAFLWLVDGKQPPHT